MTKVGRNIRSKWRQKHKNQLNTEIQTIHENVPHLPSVGVLVSPLSLGPLTKALEPKGSGQGLFLAFQREISSDVVPKSAGATFPVRESKPRVLRAVIFLTFLCFLMLLLSEVSTSVITVLFPCLSTTTMSWCMSTTILSMWLWKCHRILAWLF